MRTNRFTPKRISSVQHTSESSQKELVYNVTSKPIATGQIDPTKWKSREWKKKHTHKHFDSIDRVVLLLFSAIWSQLRFVQSQLDCAHNFLNMKKIVISAMSAHLVGFLSSLPCYILEVVFSVFLFHSVALYWMVFVFVLGLTYHASIPSPQMNWIAAMRSKIDFGALYLLLISSAPW